MEKMLELQLDLLGNFDCLSETKNWTHLTNRNFSLSIFAQDQASDEGQHDILRGARASSRTHTADHQNGRGVP